MNAETPVQDTQVKENAVPLTNEVVNEKKPVPGPKQIKSESIDALSNYFTPGNIVKGYGGSNDRVVSFNPGDGKGNNWNVTVEAVQKDSAGNWVTDKEFGQQRTHATMPDKKDLARGPVESTSTKEQADGQDKGETQAETLLSQESAAPTAAQPEAPKEVKAKVEEISDADLEAHSVTVTGALPNGQVGKYEVKAKQALADIDEEIRLYELIKDCVGGA